MSTGHVLLGLLVERPKHGYELKREHDRRLPGAKPLAYGQVYATLQRLQSRLDGVCSRIDAADAQRATCEGLLRKSGA